MSPAKTTPSGSKWRVISSGQSHLYTHLLFLPTASPSKANPFGHKRSSTSHYWPVLTILTHPTIPSLPSFFFQLKKKIQCFYFLFLFFNGQWSSTLNNTPLYPSLASTPTHKTYSCPDNQEPLTQILKHPKGSFFGSRIHMDLYTGSSEPILCIGLSLPYYLCVIKKLPRIPQKLCIHRFTLNLLKEKIPEIPGETPWTVTWWTVSSHWRNHTSGSWRHGYK